jgi:hypothetical protein
MRPQVTLSDNNSLRVTPKITLGNTFIHFGWRFPRLQALHFTSGVVNPDFR